MCLFVYLLSIFAVAQAQTDSHCKCQLRVESKGWYDRGEAYARFYINDVLQAFTGGTSYDASNVYKGFGGTHGYNFARLKFDEVSGACELERIGYGYYTYESKYCTPVSQIREKFEDGDIILVGVKDTGSGCGASSEDTLAAAGAVKKYGSTWRQSYALIGIAGSNPSRICEEKSGSSAAVCSYCVPNAAEAVATAAAVPDEFKKRTSGSCTDESGWGWVTTQEDCEKGAKALGWDSGTYVESEFSDPRSCSWCAGCIKKVIWNTEASSTRDCSTSNTAYAPKTMQAQVTVFQKIPRPNQTN
jgi:hypothetical protein